MVDRRPRSLLLWTRLAVIAAFLVLMPVLAMPAVSRSVDYLLYEQNPSERADSELTGETVVTAEHRDSLVAAAAPVVELGGSTSGGPLLEWKLAALSVESVRIEEIQQRLKQLGASYLLLEQLDEGEKPFHFRCVMPVPGSGVYGRPFDATEKKALAAMELVLAEVEQWCAETGRIRSASQESPVSSPHRPLR
jgi:hypothetical protein